MRRRYVLRERGKAQLRAALGRANLGLVRSPYENSVARMLRWLEIDTVVDIGANIGQYAAGLVSFGYTGRIISCEPLHDEYAYLAARSRRRAGWETVHAAVGSSTGRSTINLSENSYSSSLLDVSKTQLAADPRSRVVASQDIDVVTVDDLVHRFGIDTQRALMKVDTQGSESEVLAGASATLSSFAAVQLELSFVPLYSSQQLFDEHVALLAQNGFALFSLNAGVSDPRTGRLLQADGLFVARDRMA